MNCPLCQTAMLMMDYEGACVHTCTSCGGEFIGPETLAHIVNTRDERFDASLRAQLTRTRPKFGEPTDGARCLACPGCNGSMRVTNYCGDSGVCVDRCDACGGLWLDHLELEKVQILLEQWADDAPAQIQAVAAELENVRRETAERLDNAFAGSRFAFVNALINRVLDAA